MSLRKKNIRLIVLLGVMIVTSIALALMDSKSVSSIDNKEAFSVQDTAAVDMITITSGTGKVELTNENNVWKINGSF